MDLRQLKYFVHVARTGSLTGASSTAWVSQSALSRQMKLLEDELGVALFDRQARGVRLTEAGECLFARASVLLDEAEALKHVVGLTRREPSGLLRVGAPPSLGAMLIAPFAVRSRDQCPKVTLSLREGTSRGMRDALGNGEVDVAVCSDLEPLDAFEARQLLAESLFWVGPPQARLSLRTSVSVKTVGSRPLILTAYPNSLRLIVDRAMSKQGLQIAPAVEADTVGMMIELIRRGLGYTVLPYSAVHAMLSLNVVSASAVKGLSIRWMVAHSRERTRTLAIDLAMHLLGDVARERVRSGEWKTARLDN